MEDNNEKIVTDEENKNVVVEEKKEKKEKKGVNVFLLLILIIIFFVGGWFAGNYFDDFLKKFDNTKDTVDKVDNESTNYVELSGENKELVENYLKLGSAIIFKGSDVESSIESKLDDQEKMNLTLWTKYGKLIGDSVCKSDGKDEVVKVSDLPVLFEDNSFIDNYKNDKYNSLNQTELALNDYQETKNINKVYDNPYILKYSNDNFYVRNRFCGRIGPNPMDYIKYISEEENDNEIVVKLNYVYTKIVDTKQSTDGQDEMIYSFSSSYDGLGNDEVERKNGLLSSEIFNTLDLSKYKTYTVTFDKVDNGFIFKSVKVED